MSVETFLKWKILPRFMMLCKHGNELALCGVVHVLGFADWLPQSAFVSVVMGVMTGVFGIWMGHEHKD